MTETINPHADQHGVDAPDCCAAQREGHDLVLQLLF